MFRLVSDHHIQRGPTFPKPSDVLIDGVSGQITQRSTDGTVIQSHLNLPTDVSNGLPPNLLLNILPSDIKTTISYVIPGEKPRLIRVSIKNAGEAQFSVGGIRRKATDYVLHAELGGVLGVVAPLVGKQPADYHIWILGGKSPALIREEGQFYDGGSIWRVEQLSPTFAP